MASEKHSTPAYVDVTEAPSLVPVEVDLTQLEPAVLRNIFEKLRSVADSGLPSGFVPSANSAQHASKRKEAMRLHTEMDMSARLIQLQMELSEPKEALELLIDEVWSTRGNVSKFSFVPLMKEFQLASEFLESVREVLSDADASQLDMIELSTKCGFLPFSTIELAVVILYTETLSSPLYQDVLRNLALVDAELANTQMNTDEAIAMLDAQMKTTSAELALKHENQYSKSLEELKKQAELVEETFAPLLAQVKSLKETADKYKRQQMKDLEAEAVSIDDSTPRIGEIVPTRFRGSTLEPDEEGEDVQVLKLEQIQRHPRLPNDFRTHLPLHNGDECMALLSKPHSTEPKWELSTLQQMREAGCVRHYNVKGKRSSLEVWVDGSRIAYGSALEYSLEIGIRVVAFYVDDIYQQFTGWYSGTVGEHALQQNNWRYLIFFDDGGVQYVKENNIRIIYEQRENRRQTWMDLPDTSEGQPLREFMKSYLTKFPDRLMYKVRKVGEKIAAEKAGTWFKGQCSATVVKMDASLILVRFPPIDGHIASIEWLYRGSPRLYELSRTERRMAEQQPRQRFRAVRNLTQRQHRIEYGGAGIDWHRERVADENKERRKAQTARKSTAGRRIRGIGEETEEYSDEEEEKFPIISHEEKSCFVYEQLAEARLGTRTYRKHNCGPNCLQQIRDDPTLHFGKSPFFVPLLFGWERSVAEAEESNKRHVYYVTPCGRRLARITDISNYLHVTGSRLPQDYFSFEPKLDPYRKYMVKDPPVYRADYSNGKEKVPISVVNSYTAEEPHKIDYSARRFEYSTTNPLEKIPLICSGCSCTDDCLDSSKCACQQLTMEELGRVLPDARAKPYAFRRLTKNIKTGIFECNSECKCNTKRCVNRVAQRDLITPLQLFKTRQKGWGIRTLVDLPPGQFVCIYAGAIIGDLAADQLGREQGDEYFADLDLIRAVEFEKEGYEEDAPEMTSDEDFSDGENSSNEATQDGYAGSKAPSTSVSRDREVRESTRTTSYANLLAAERPDSAASESSGGSGGEPGTARKRGGGTHSPQNAMMPSAPLPNQPEGESSGSAKPTRVQFSFDDYFKSHYEFTIDAKRRGNIGRYLNHSCDPNVFVQNVLVDSHDLRFPWVSFFASKFIKAGEELCWDYGYEVGSIEGRRLICRCGTKNCRGRLL